jgi:glutathione synthase
MKIKLGVVMDPIQTIHYEKDSTLALLWEADKRDNTIYYFELADLFLRDGVPYGRARQLSVSRDPNKWYAFHDEAHLLPLSSLDVILMRKDPPVDAAYLYATYLLEYAVLQGVRVMNHPRSLRDCNEKYFISSFPACTPPTLITASIPQLHDFLHEQREIVCKPLNNKGGESVFYVKHGNKNVQVIFEMLTHKGCLPIMAQRFIPDIALGDKRIILVCGKPVPAALARIPAQHDWRGNLAAGAHAAVQPLSERDQWICSTIGPVLRERGLDLVGIDVIGDYLTEINVTSPTGIRELDREMNGNISAQLFDAWTA